VRKQHIPTLTASALCFIAIYIIVIGAWGMFPRAMSKTIAPQERISPAELLAAIEAQKQAAAKLTRSASFDQRFRKLSEQARKKGTVPVIVKVRAAFRPEGQISSAAERLAQRSVIGEAQDQMLSWMRYVPSTLKRYKSWPYIAASVDATCLEQLQASSEALDVYEDKPMRLALAESLPRVGAPRAWAGGFTGAGKTIAVLDSGVDKNHLWLSGKVVSEACFSTNNPAQQSSSVCPGGVESSTDPGSGVPCTVLDGVGNCGHGTHIAGIAAGRSGVAYNANVISIQVMSFVNDSEACRGQAPCLLCNTSDLMSGLRRVYDLSGAYDIAAVNVSLATDGFTSYCDADFQDMKDAIDLLRSVNIATVIASGNDFFTNALGYPACISSGVSVGATSDGSDSAAPLDAVLQFSNSASFLNLLAPGSFITSSVPGGGVEGSFGTSQAAAHVSGAWAMLKQQQPSATVDEVLNKLTTFGVNITDPRNGVTKPRIQMDAALGVNVPPNNWIGAYFNNRDLAGAPVVVRGDGGGFIDRNFSGISPAPGTVIGTENYSIRWTRTLTLTAGTYRFSATCDDGCRFYVDNQLKIDEWRNQPATTYNVNVDLPAGNHEIRLEYYQNTGSAQVRLIWGLLNPACSQTVAADRWRGEYFNNANLAGSSSMVRDDGASVLSFNWGDGSPSSACDIFADYFSARWTRTVNFAAGVYRFTAAVDNGVRLYVDGQLKIDQWGNLPANTYTADVSLSAGDHNIELDFGEYVGGAGVNLSWAPLPPGSPSNLVASAASISQINLSWADSSNFEDGFKIERWNGSSYSQIATVGPNVTTYADSGLAPSTTYTYRVRAFNSGGDSGYSNESSATTRGCSYSLNPANLFGLYYFGGSFTISVTAAPGCSWTAVSNNAWIRITSGNFGTGNGAVLIDIDEYGGATQRSGSLTIAGQLVRVTQSPCSNRLNCF
jgi:hypothetical protein